MKNEFKAPTRCKGNSFHVRVLHVCWCALAQWRAIAVAISHCITWFETQHPHYLSDSLPQSFVVPSLQQTALRLCLARASPSPCVWVGRHCVRLQGFLTLRPVFDILKLKELNVKNGYDTQRLRR